MKTLSRLILAAVIISFISCSKSSDTTNPIVTNQSVYLSKVFIIDAAIAAPFDTIARGKYTYDAQKRPVLAESVQTNAAGQTIGKLIYRFQYNGTDTLASSFIEEFTNYSGGVPTTTDKDTINYTFVNGKCTYDSVHGAVAPGQTHYSVRRYTYLAGNIIKVAATGKSWASPTIFSSQHTVRQNFINGDISYQLDTSLTLVPALPVSGFRLENTVTFINKPNPFARFSDPIRRPYLLDDVGIGATFTSPKYLFSQHSYVFDSWNGATTNHNQGTISYTYTFRPDGYPTEMIETGINGKITKGILVYE